MIAIPGQIELDPLEIDSRCELCGCTIAFHVMVDDGSGPIFYCPDDLETQIHLAVANLVKQWELADPRDRWKHTGEAPPKAADVPKPRARPPYNTSAPTIDA